MSNVDIAALDNDVTVMKKQLSGLVKYLAKEKTTVATMLNKMSNLETSNDYRLQVFEKWKESMEPIQLQMIQLESRIDVLVTHIDQLKDTMNDMKQTDSQLFGKFEKIGQLSHSLTSANREINRLRREFDLSLQSLRADTDRTTDELVTHSLKLERIFNMKTVIFAIGAAIVGAVTVISIVKDWIHFAPVGQ